MWESSIFKDFLAWMDLTETGLLKSMLKTIYQHNFWLAGSSAAIQSEAMFVNSC